MTAKARMAASLLGLAVGIGASIYLGLELAGRSGETERTHAEDAPTFLVPFPPEEITALEIVVRGALHRLQRDSEGTWFYHAHQHAPVEAATHEHASGPGQADAIAEAVAMFGRTRIEREISVGRDAGSRYGVTLPPVIVMIYVGDEARPKLRLHVGDVAPDGFSRYVQVAGRAAVVTIPDYQIENLTRLIASLSRSSSP